MFNTIWKCERHINKRNTFDVGGRYLSSDHERIRIASYCYNQRFDHIYQIPGLIPFPPYLNTYVFQDNTVDGNALYPVPMEIVYGNYGCMYRIF